MGRKKQGFKCYLISGGDYNWGIKKETTFLNHSTMVGLILFLGKKMGLK